MLFRARKFTFTFPRPTLVMGIVNVTPDSFSDGGKFQETARAVEHAHELVRQGADIIDIGGESTRPGATPVETAEELRRVVPVIAALARELAVPISIDTMKPVVARAALEAGASIVNDVGAGFQTGDMGSLIREFSAGYVCMHADGPPPLPPATGYRENLPAEIEAFFSKQLAALLSAGVPSEQIVLDPGIGFGKSPENNLELLARLPRFQKFQRPLLVGMSRKSFLEKISAPIPNERLPASLACATLAIVGGAGIIRAHDVAATAQTARVTEAVMSLKSDVDRLA